jgi:hypothetical protein
MREKDGAGTHTGGGRQCALALPTRGFRVHQAGAMHRDRGEVVTACSWSVLEGVNQGVGRNAALEGRACSGGHDRKGHERRRERAAQALKLEWYQDRKQPKNRQKDRTGAGGPDAPAAGDAGVAGASAGGPRAASARQGGRGEHPNPLRSALHSA